MELSVVEAAFLKYVWKRMTVAAVRMITSLYALRMEIFCVHVFVSFQVFVSVDIINSVV